jgi:GDP-L-fucose synthase
LPALIRKFYEGKVNKTECVEVWGSGEPKREFLYVDDLADACVYILESVDGEKLYDKMGISHLNIGYGEDLSITELADMIAEIVGFTGRISYDSSKPDGTPRKLLDITRLKNLGWSPTLTLHEGIRKSYEWYLEHHSDINY